MTRIELKFLKFRHRSGVVHIIQEGTEVYCGTQPNASTPFNPLIFMKKPSGRICAYCQNRLREEIKELVK